MNRRWTGPVIVAAMLAMGVSADQAWAQQAPAPAAPAAPSAATPPDGVARGVVRPPPVDPGMVTPPPASTPDMPVIKPPGSAR